MHHLVPSYSANENEWRPLSALYEFPDAYRWASKELWQAFCSFFRSQVPHLHGRPARPAGSKGRRPLAAPSTTASDDDYDVTYAAAAPHPQPEVSGQSRSTTGASSQQQPRTRVRRSSRTRSHAQVGGGVLRHMDGLLWFLTHAVYGLPVLW